MNSSMVCKLLRIAAPPICLAFGFAIAGLPSAAVAAPDPDANSSSNAANMDEIVVTARKRTEKLLDVPIAIVAFSSKAIEEQAIYSLGDLASATPGLSENTTLGGSARSDRSFPQYIMRGMVPSTSLNATTTVFIDGAPIISGQVEGLDDLERIEVLEGPQSAYFGRQTFAGAINLVTKDPGNTFGGSVNVLAGNPNYYDTRVSVEGPIVSDILTARANYRYYTKDGSYRNEALGDAAPGRLGNQSTQSTSLELVAKPVENLKIKGLYMFWADRDGPSAQAFIGPSQANCLGGTWFCGTVPRAAGNQPAANTLVDAPLAAFLRDVTNPAVTNPPGTKLPKQALFTPPQKFGLARNAYHWSVGIDYDIPGLFTISSLTALDNQKWGEFQDLDNVDTSAIANPFLAFSHGPYVQSTFNNPFLVETRYRSFSQELRLTSDQQQRFRWLVGVNYAWTRLDSTLDGPSPFTYFVGDAPTATNNTGAFFGLGFDVLQQLTVSLDGRFERDEQNALTAGFRDSVNNFTPRLSVQYKFTPDFMAYVTYSEGVNPGTFNAGILQLNPADLANLQATYGAKVVVTPEKLRNYEIGLKGEFFDRKLTVTSDIYYDIWSDQINAYAKVYVENGATKLTTFDLNNGRVKVTGLESKINWQPVSHLDIDASGAINATSIQSGPCYTCGQIVGSPNPISYSVNGNQLPNTSKYQAALGIQYGGALAFAPEWEWYGRADDQYKSGNYASADNLVRSPNLNFVNFRAGVSHENLRLEAFVDNAFNEGGATNLALFYNVANPFETYARNDALVAGLPVLRTYGIRAKYKFGGAK